MIAWSVTDKRSNRTWDGASTSVRDGQVACQIVFRSLGRADLTGVSASVTGKDFRGKTPAYRAASTKRGQGGLILMWRKDG